jgi:hypothetical protein
MYWFAARLLRMMVTLIANAVCRVFFKDAVTTHQTGNCSQPLLVKVTLLQAIAGMLPMLVLAANGPAWRAAGEYARWLAIWSWFDLMAAPAGMPVSVYAVQRPFFYADLLGALTGAAALALAAASGRFELAIGLYVAAIAGRKIYSIGFMLNRAAGLPKNDG